MQQMGLQRSREGLPWLLKQAKQPLTRMRRASRECISVSVLPDIVGQRVLGCTHTSDQQHWGPVYLVVGCVKTKGWHAMPIASNHCYATVNSQ